MRPSTIILAAAALLVGDHGRAAGQDALPGSASSVARAKQDARYIVVARVGRTGDVLSNRAGGPSIQTWTELKPSAVLKGKIGEEELNQLPLSIRIEGRERFPKSGEELIVFVGGPSGDGAITKMMPKTDANLAVIETAPAEPRADRVGMLPAGEIGGHLGGGVLPPAPSPAADYRGTKIIPGAGATGGLLKVQNEFAAAMSGGDPKPEDRQAHFAWLEKNEYVRRYGVQQVGWYGTILRCEPRPAGGWRITVGIHPWLHSARYLRHTLVLDSVEETYEFIDGQVRLVKSNAALAKPNRRGFPVAW